MVFQTPSNNAHSTNQDLPKPNNGEALHPHHSFFEHNDSTCSTPYVSAPSSPTPITGFFYSAPASPMHFAITAGSSQSSSLPPANEFEFSARFGSTGFNSSGSMSSADELFLNGQIRPMKLSTHLERPQVLAPLLDLHEEEEEEEVESSHVVRGRDLRLRDKSLRRRTRSLSPLRNTVPSEWTENNEHVIVTLRDDDENTNKKGCSSEITPSVSASSSRSSSAGRSSKRWVFLKDFLRSKSEGRSNNKFWSTISFSPTKDKKNQENGSSGITKSKGNSQPFSKKVTGKPTNGVGKRRVPVPASPHELHYKVNRAQAEEMRKKTFLPYKQGLFGFSSKGYGAMSGFARALNPVSSR